MLGVAVISKKQLFRKITRIDIVSTSSASDLYLSYVDPSSLAVCMGMNRTQSKPKVVFWRWPNQTFYLRAVYIGVHIYQLGSFN